MKSGSFQGKPFNGTVIQIHAPTTDAEETEADESYQLEDPLELREGIGYPLQYSWASLVV